MHLTYKVLNVHHYHYGQTTESNNGRAIFSAFLVFVAMLASGGSSASAAVTLAGPGSAAGQVNVPVGIAVDQSKGTVYMADSANRRIDEFNLEGHFEMAFGLGVLNGKEELQMCTTTTACREGLPGFGAGAVQPDSLVVNQATHDLFVAEAENGRVQEFTPGGEFVLMFGKSVDQGPHHAGSVCTANDIKEGDVCGRGVFGNGPGEISNEGGLIPVSVDSSGNVWVGGIERIEKFSSEGVSLPQITLSGVGKVHSLGIDSSGNFYLLSSNIGGVQKPPTISLLAISPNRTVFREEPQLSSSMTPPVLSSRRSAPAK
jgi:hypothetical protein